MAFTARTETYVNVSSLTTPFNITVTKPTGTVDGDILFVWIGWYAAVTIDSVPSGWNLLGQYIANTDRYALYYKVASSEGANWVWSFTATAKVRAVCSCYTSGDFNASDPIDVVSNTAYRTSDANCRAASMTVALVNSPLIYWGGCYSTASKTYTKPSVPTTGWVEDDDAGSTTPDFWTEVCSFIWSGSGATGIMSATISAALITKHAFAVALKPVAGGQTFYSTIPATVTGTGVLSRVNNFKRTLSSIVTGVSLLSRRNSFYRTLSAEVSGSPSLVKGMYVNLVATVIGTVLISTSKVVSQTLIAIAQGTSVLSKIPTFAKTLSATAIGVVTLSRANTFYRTLTSTVTTVSILSRGMYQTLNAIATVVGVFTVAKMFSKTLSSITVGVAALSTTKMFIKVLDAITHGIASLIHWKQTPIIFTDIPDSLTFTNIGDSLKFTDILDTLDFTNIPNTVRFTDIDDSLEFKEVAL